MHSLAAGDVPEVLLLAVSPSWIAFGWITPCLNPFPGWPTSSAWLTCCMGLALSLLTQWKALQGRSIFRALCQQEISPRLSASFALLPTGVGLQDTLHLPPARIPTPESTYQGISYGNNKMTILQMRTEILGKSTCLSSESHLLWKLKVRPETELLAPAPPFSVSFKLISMLRLRPSSYFPRDILKFPSHLDTLTICSVWHMVMEPSYILS